MPISSDLKHVLSLIRNLKDDDPANGGRIKHPFDIAVSGQPGSFWPAVFEQDLTAGIEYTLKHGLLSAPVDNSELAFPVFSYFDTILLSGVPDTNSVAYWWVGTDEDTAATNNEATADKYGVGRIVAPSGIAVNNTAWDLEVYSADVQSGAHAIIKVGYKIRIEARTTYGGSGSFETLEVGAMTGTTGTSIQFTTTAGCVNTYADGDRISSYPEITTAQKAEVESIDKSGLTGGAATFDETGVEVYSNVPRMVLTLTIEAGAVTYSASTDVVGWESSGSLGGSIPIGTDKLFSNTDPNYLLDMIKIPANAFNGTLVVGDTVALTISPSILNVWERLKIAAGASPGTRSKQTGSGGQSA